MMEDPSITQSSQIDYSLEEMEFYLILAGRWNKFSVNGKVFWRLIEESDDYYGSFYALEAAYEREMNIYGPQSD